MPTQSYRDIEIPSDYHRAKEVEDAIIDSAQSHGYHEDDLFALRLSLEEALTNAIRHGNAGDREKKVILRYYINENQADIYVADEGPGFDPTAVPDPTITENLSQPNGRGILLMRAYMNLVEYNDTGNVVHMVKLNSKP
ncbi:MAG: ATP-binding protein [Sedimentisphaerales bacterium]|nr:ATP-binding protein [Sedimentisphaerales bacterium]